MAFRVAVLVAINIALVKGQEVDANGGAGLCGVETDCWPIEYGKQPWPVGNGLLMAQGECKMTTGDQTVPAFNMSLRLDFEDAFYQVTQHTLVEKEPQKYQNLGELVIDDYYLFAFLVKYEGEISYYPSTSYTPPPVGTCGIYREGLTGYLG